jgi:hypothetical protein
LNRAGARFDVEACEVAIMPEHDDDLESEVDAGAAIEKEKYPQTAEELECAAEDAPEPEDQDEDIDDDASEF